MLKKLLAKLGIHFWKEENILLSIEELKEEEKKYLKGTNGLSLKYTQFRHSSDLTLTHNSFLHHHLEYCADLPMYKKIRICKLCGKYKNSKKVTG